MKSSKLRRLAVIAGMLSGSALAAPFANVPSVATAGQPFELRGGGFEPGSLVYLRVVGPKGAVAPSAAVVAADGTIAHTLVSAKSGAHSIQLHYADGRVASSELRFVVGR